MFRLVNNNIFLTRGDSLCLDLDIVVNAEKYELQDGDKVVFTVKRSIYERCRCLQKQLINNQFVFVPDDTNNLDYGEYKYDVQLTTADGEVYTIIPPHNFTLEGEVTW